MRKNMATEFPGLFDSPKAEELRDAGIAKAANHANAMSEKWTDKAFDFVKKYLEYTQDAFQTEDLRMASLSVLPEPPSKRAWGFVIVQACKSGLIKRVGYAPVTNPKAHKTPAAVWVRV